MFFCCTDAQTHPKAVKGKIFRTLLLFRRMLCICDYQAFSFLSQGNLPCVCAGKTWQEREQKQAWKGNGKQMRPRIKRDWATSKISVNHFESACRVISPPNKCFHPLPLSLFHVASSVYRLNPSKLLVMFLLISLYIYRNSSQSIHIHWEMLFLKIVIAAEAFLGRNSITLYHLISKLGIRDRRQHHDLL